jgi:flagellar hook-associated protein 3 FlgL
MIVSGGSDLARLQRLQRQASEARERMDVATQEMSTGETADRHAATGGNLSRLISLDRALARNATFASTISLTGLRLDTMQATITGIAGAANALAVSLNETVPKGDVASALRLAKQARGDLTDTLARLNVQVAGQSLFAGTATDRPAIGPADGILADLDALAAGSVTAADAIAAIDAYFASPAGAFHSGAGYLGSTEGLAGADIGEGERLDYGVSATDDRIVAVLKAQAKAAVAGGPAFAASNEDRLALLAAAGRDLLAAKDGAQDLSFAIGFDQQTLETAKAARTAESNTLSLARAQMVGADIETAATTYQALETQLDSILTVTARLSNLRFTNYMR